MLLSLFAAQAQETSVSFKPSEEAPQISRHIYGHFAEHLGRSIYDGLYVGEESSIPNTDGVRNDIIQALKELGGSGTIEEIEAKTAELAGLTDEQLDTPYRPGGWTIRQVVHHVPDSHVNAYVRFKLTLTEDHPTIKPYDEKGWASLPDVGITPIETNLRFLELLHEKWVELLRSVSREDLSRPFMHPINGITPLDWNLGHYAWHGRHHLAHIKSTIERNAWRKARR